jgi:hypothetical protein
MILSNGDRSTKKDSSVKKFYDHMMPAGSHKKIRSVRINGYSGNIEGFMFFDKEGALLYKIGNTTWGYE